MKNVISYFTKEIQNFYFGSLAITGQDEASLKSSFDPINKKDLIVDDKETLISFISKHFLSNLKNSLIDTIFKKEETKEVANKEKTISFNNSVLYKEEVEKGSDEILNNIAKSFNASIINTKEKLNFDEREKVKVNISKTKRETENSSLLFLSKVDLDLVTGEIKISDKTTILFDDIVKKWTDRESFLMKQHLFIILETHATSININKNYFIQKIKKDYLFRSISLIIVPDLHKIEEVNSKGGFYLNRNNFIGNAASITRDFDIDFTMSKICLEYENYSAIKKEIDTYADKIKDNHNLQADESYLLNNTKIKRLGKLVYLDKVNINSKTEERFVKSVCCINFPNGTYYEGEIEEYKDLNISPTLNGFGTFVNSDSTTHCGSFIKNLKHGKGCFINSKFHCCMMIWNNNIQNGYMREYAIDEKTYYYEGKMQNGKYHGAGVLKISDDKYFKGFFNNGEKEYGTLILIKLAIVDPKAKVLKKEISFYEIFKGTWLNDQPNIGLVSSGTSATVYTNTDVGEVVFDNIDCCYRLKHGILHIGNFNKSKSLVSYGSNMKYSRTTVNEKNIWKIEKSELGLMSSATSNHYFQRTGKEELEEEEVNEANGTKGLVGYLSCQNGDIYIGEYRKNMPNFFGVLYRKESNQFEIGDFDCEDSTHKFYFLNSGIIIKNPHDGIVEKPDKDLKHFYYYADKEYGQTGNRYIRVLDVNLNEGIIYKGCGIPEFELFPKIKPTDKDKENKGKLARYIKKDLKGQIYYVNEKVEIDCILNEDKIIYGRYKNKETNDIYLGEFNQNRRFEGYGKLQFGNHPIYSSYTGKFKNGIIHGQGTLKYKNNSVEKGFFKINSSCIINANEENVSVVQNFTSHRYHVFGNIEIFYPTYNPSYVKGFNIEDQFTLETFICETKNENNEIVKNELRGNFIYDKDLQQKVLEVYDSDNSVKSNIVINNKRNKLEICIINYDKDGKMTPYNIKMSEKYLYYGSLNSKLEMDGKGKIKFKDESYYVGYFKNNKFNGKGTQSIKENITHKGENIEMIKLLRGDFKDNMLSGKNCVIDYNSAIKRTIFLYGKFGREVGNFNNGLLIEGYKQFYVSPTKVIVGRFYYNSEEFTKIPKNSTIICKGILCVKGMNSTTSFGGLIVESNNIPGEYNLFDNGIKFYSFNPKLGQFKIKTISQVREVSAKTAGAELTKERKKYLQGKGRVYTNNDKNPTFNAKTTRNEFNNTTIIHYEGDFHNGFYEGKGIIYYNNGDLFMGDIKKTVVDMSKNVIPQKGEFGTFLQPLVGIYTGYFKNEELNGRAIMIFQNGIKYKGETKKNKAHGKGILYFPDGTHYEGNFVNNKMVGHSKFYFPNGNCLLCYLDEDSQINGNGTFIYKDETVIKCHLVNNLIRGLGKMITKDFEISGGFKNFQPFGGVSIYKGDLIAYGNVDENGIFEGKVNLKNGNKIDYKGDYNLNGFKAKK